MYMMNKHSQKPTDMFNKQDVTVYLTYIKILVLVYLFKDSFMIICPKITKG